MIGWRHRFANRAKPAGVDRRIRTVLRGRGTALPVLSHPSESANGSVPRGEAPVVRGVLIGERDGCQIRSGRVVENRSSAARCVGKTRVIRSGVRR